MDAKQIIAYRIANELKENYKKKGSCVVNLGIGVPTLVPNYLPPEVNIILHCENGLIGLGPSRGEPIPGLIDAGCQPCGIEPGGVFCDSAMSFSLVRGGHIDIAVLGALQVDEHGNLANWTVPGKKNPGIGGAMDLVTGVKNVIVAMVHCTKDGGAKILKECTLPLTGKARVKKIVTEMAIFRIDNGLVLEELQPGVTIDDVSRCTEADFRICR